MSPQDLGTRNLCTESMIDYSVGLGEFFFRSERKFEKGTGIRDIRTRKEGKFRNDGKETSDGKDQKGHAGQLHPRKIGQYPGNMKT